MEPEASLQSAHHLCNIYDQLIAQFLTSLLEQIPLCLAQSKEKN
jgi:hypothetical protein